MIGRTALALLIESKRDEEDPRVLPFRWGDDMGWSRRDPGTMFPAAALAPRSVRPVLPSVASNSLSVGSFGASLGGDVSRAESARRLLVGKKQPTRADREADLIKRARTWFAPHLVLNPAARNKPYQWPGKPSPDKLPRGGAGLEAGGSLSLSHRSRESAPGSVASSTVASRARSVPGALFLDDDDDDVVTAPYGDAAGSSVRFSDVGDDEYRQTAPRGDRPAGPPTAADLRALARVKTPTEDLALLAAALLVVVHDGGGVPADVKWPAFVARAKLDQGKDLKAAAARVARVDAFKRRALHSFLDGRLKASAARFSKRQGKALRTLETWIRATLASADREEDPSFP